MHATYYAFTARGVGPTASGKVVWCCRSTNVPFRGNFGVNISENDHFLPIVFLAPDSDSSRPCGWCQVCFTFELLKSRSVEVLKCHKLARKRGGHDIMKKLYCIVLTIPRICST